MSPVRRGECRMACVTRHSENASWSPGAFVAPSPRASARPRRWLLRDGMRQKGRNVVPEMRPWETSAPRTPFLSPSPRPAGASSRRQPGDLHACGRMPWMSDQEGLRLFVLGCFICAGHFPEVTQSLPPGARWGRAGRAPVPGRMLSFVGKASTGPAWDCLFTFETQILKKQKTKTSRN